VRGARCWLNATACCAGSTTRRDADRRQQETKLGQFTGIALATGERDEEGRGPSAFASSTDLVQTSGEQWRDQEESRSRDDEQMPVAPGEYRDQVAGNGEQQAVGEAGNRVGAQVAPSCVQPRKWPCGRDAAHLWCGVVASVGGSGG